jgi:Na+/H+-translocating membrane pyrophosphatase
MSHIEGSTMTIRSPSARSSQSGTTFFELLMLIVCAVVALNFSVYLASPHHWLLGIVAFPLGFCSAAYVIGMLGEIAVRCGYRRGGRTPSPLIWRSLFVATILGVAVGFVFYFLVIRGIISTVLGSSHTRPVSAFLLGGSVALTVAFVLTLQGSNKEPITPKTACLHQET